MKFIGQYIQSLIARFRNDVYLEDISTGTIASGGNLGLDSNNKIVKATSTSHDEVTLAGTPDYITISGQEITRNAVDLAADVTGVLPSANLDADTAHLSVAQAFTAAKTFEAAAKLQFRDANAYINSPTANDLEISATDITLDAAGPVYLDAGAGNAITFQEAGTTIADITAHHAGTYLNMYENEGASTDDFFSIGVEAAGATTIATADDSGSNGANLVFNVQGTFSVASTGIDIATNGTITNATWQGDAIATTYTAAKVTSIVAGEGVDVSGATGDVTISGEDATTSNKGIASFSSDNFAVSSGAVTIKSGGVDLAAEVTGVLPTANIADDAVTFAKASGVSPKVFGSTIKILPSDFMSNDDGGSTKFGIGFVETDGTGFGMKIPNSGTELLAFVSIPEGMKATHVDIFDQADDRAIEVFEANVNSRTITSKGSGNCNTTLDITDVNATATNYLLILVTTTATSDRVYGGTVTIAAQ